MTQVFISYSRRDLAFVEQLAADLKAAGLDVWYDLSGLEGGQRWSKEIEKAIRESQYVLVVLSPDSVASKWVEEEFLYASELGKKIIPLFYKKCALPFGYRTLHFIDIQGSKYKQKFGEILRSLDVKPIVQKKSYPPEESFPPGWDETWQPTFDKSYSVSRKSDDRQKQPIKSETKTEKPKPKRKSIQQRWIIAPVVLIGALLAAVFGLPSLFTKLEKTPEPTQTLTEYVTIEPSPTKTGAATKESTLTQTEAYTLTPTPLPTEIIKTASPIATLAVTSGLVKVSETIPLILNEGDNLSGNPILARSPNSDIVRVSPKDTLIAVGKNSDLILVKTSDGNLGWVKGKYIDGQLQEELPDVVACFSFNSFHGYAGLPIPGNPPEPNIVGYPRMPYIVLAVDGEFHILFWIRLDDNTNVWVGGSVFDGGCVGDITSLPTKGQ
jgi:hypothetical protein